MIVVADSGPLHYLILLDHTDLLRRFYGRVLVPEAVASELSSAGAPPIVRDWIEQPPSWVDVVPVASEAVQAITDELDLGERTAIALAATLGVPRAGAEQSLVNVPDMLGRLKSTSFYVDDALVNAIFQRWLKL
jgi:hypothetical protein